MKDYIRLIYKMSRSTPLSNLPSRESTQAYDQKENELVKEILQEIDTDKNQQPNVQQQQAMLAQQQQQQQQQAMMAQQHEQEQAMLAQQESQHMQEQEMMHNQMLDNMETPAVQPASMVDKVIGLVKQPALVAIIAIVVSVPALSNMIENMIISKASLASYATIIILLVKGIIAGGLYFGLNKSL